MLASLKAIKMTGTNEKVAANLEALRDAEFDASKMFRTLMVGGVITCKHLRIGRDLMLTTNLSIWNVDTLPCHCLRSLCRHNSGKEREF